MVGCGDLVPTEGAWVSSDFTYSQNDCAFDEIEGDVSLELTVIDDMNLAVSLGDDADTDCTLSNGSIECAAVTSVVPIDGLDAELSIDQGLTGEMVTNSEMIGTLTIEMSCTGTECELVAAASDITLPCSNVASGTWYAQN